MVGHDVTKLGGCVGHGHYILFNIFMEVLTKEGWLAIAYSLKLLS